MLRLANRPSGGGEPSSRATWGRRAARAAAVVTALCGACAGPSSDWEARLARVDGAPPEVAEDVLPFGLWLPVRARGELVAPLRVAYELSLAGDVEGALALVSALRARGPEASELVAVSAALQRLAGYPRAAEHELARAVELAPADVGLALGLAELRLELGLPTAAIQALAAARRTVPADPHVNRLLARAWGRLGRPTEARGHFDQALSAAVDERLETLLEAARVLTAPACRLRATAADEAWVDGVLADAVELAPSSVRAWLARGAFLERAGRTAEALAAYERACALEPWNRRAWTHLALAARAGADRERFHEALERALALDADARRARRLAALAADEPEAAVAAADERELAE